MLTKRLLQRWGRGTGDLYPPLGPLQTPDSLKHRFVSVFVKNQTALVKKSLHIPRLLFTNLV